LKNEGEDIPLVPDCCEFKDLSSVTLQLLTACNLSCDYCFQDACNVSTSPQGEDQNAIDPGEAAQTIIKLLQAGKAELSMVFSGGEPMLVPVEWYEAFFLRMDRYLQESGEKLEYSIQTNISILRSAIIDLFKQHNVHFSVHYDGDMDDPKLLSKKRRDNIVTLCENGFSVTALVVGTVESLRALPATVEFFNKHGVRFYRVNYVSSQGRGIQASQIPPGLRAEAEFEAAFMASQYDFNTRDNAVMNKFLFYYNNVICGKDDNGKPRPQKCRAGVASAYIAADGFVYPCSFFPQITGPMAKTKDLPSSMESAKSAVGRCEAPNSYYDGKCRQCSALPICGEYCALSPVTDTNCIESFCSAQVTLRGLMDNNRELTELIARRFIEHKRTYPRDVPKSCGTRT
jgi:radical SAM protein with 4Fe4S-binding SPASM domain